MLKVVIFFFLLNLIPGITIALQVVSGDTFKRNKIDHFLSALYQEGQFSGAVLIANNGHLIYSKGFGFADHESKDPFTTSTPCYIGSVSKQFTAMGIMILKEQGKLDYHQSIRLYFPDLPDCMQAVTIEHGTPPYFRPGYF
jgi:CubicO group peptidase (beta-lactamase class C family)